MRGRRMDGVALLRPWHFLVFALFQRGRLERTSGIQMKRSTLSLALCCAFPAFSHAAEASLDTVVVTATRTAQTADATLAAVTLITRQDIAQSQALSLTELLRGVPGLALGNNGGAGKATTVFLRGSNSDHVLVLVDGIRIGSATTGLAALQDIPLAQIERIEIVRGPRTSLYGADAIGGVIQIFTRKGRGAASMSASLTSGSYGTYEGQAGIAGSGERGWYSVRASQQHTAGFNACRGSDSGGCYIDEPDRDGYHNTALGLGGGYRLTPDTSAEFQFLRADSNVQTDGSIYAGNQSRNRQQVLGGTLKWAPSADWNMTLRAGRSHDDSDIAHDGSPTSRYYAQRDVASWQNDVALGAGQLATLGLDSQLDRIDALPNVGWPSDVYTQTARRTQAAYAQYQGEWGGHSLQLNARHDADAQFGGRGTGGAAYGYRIGEMHRFNVSYGSAFKAPSFNQLYYPNYGTPTLRPELARSVEAGLSGRDAGWDWTARAYRTEISDLIGMDANFLPVNINTARLTGLETTARGRVAGWEVDAALTLQDPRQTSGDNSGKQLNRRAQQMLQLEAARTTGNWRFAASMYAEGRRFDDLANSDGKRLAGYGLLGVRVEYRMTPEWQLKLRLDNVLDKTYETAQYFNQPGRGVYFTLAYQP